MEIPEPVTDVARHVREQVSERRWVSLVADAQGRAEVVEGVLGKHEAEGVSYRAALEDVAPDVGWSAYQHWRRRYQAREGPAWERLLDERLPPPPRRIPDAVRQAACLLRRMDVSVTPEAARSLLKAQFGAEGDVSDASLRRFWSAAGLTRGTGGGPPSVEEVKEYFGGAGLALLSAAEAEVGGFSRMARTLLSAGYRSAVAQGEVEAREEQEDERDDHGRFTRQYNERWRATAESGKADGRWASDADKRARRDLEELPTLKHAPETLARKLLCMGVTPLLTERRGFDGLDGPAGAWLGALGGVAYMPATLDKALSEYGLLGVEDALWQAHARTWVQVRSGWCGAGDESSWLQFVVYVDVTQDPYWTRQFAKSGKVSRIGRVMPCLSRVAVHSGPGVPLVVETHAGTATLRSRLLPLLERLDQALGTGEVGRLTVVDSEAATAKLLWALHDKLDRAFISVVKGQTLKGAKVEVVGEWEPYRKHDQLREVRVTLAGTGDPPGGIRTRGVEMRRADSRRATTTTFVTSGIPKELTTAEVATAYLSRWPHQEQRFRDGRNGGGLNRSHGYGGGEVTHVALDTKLEEAQRRVARTEAAARAAEQTRAELAEKGAVRPGPARKKALGLADKDVRRTNKAKDKAQADLERLQSMPRVIYARDTGRDSVMSCLKAAVLALIEYVLREYFDGLGMEWRTFIEQVVMLPVTMRTTKTRCVYEIQANARQPERMAQLRAACEEINRREIRRGKRLLVFEVIDSRGGGS